MSIIATNSGIKRELVPAGNYVARCYSMIHIGSIVENYQGKDNVLNKVNITWELPLEKRIFNEEIGEQPMVISKEYTLSMNEKANLRKDLESWRGKGFTEEEVKSFDVTVLLGKPCMINVIHKTSSSGNEYAVISGITNLPKGMECPDQINKTFQFNFSDNFDIVTLDNFPDFLKEKIKRSEEYKSLINPEAINVQEDSNEDSDDGLPF